MNQPSEMKISNGTIDDVHAVWRPGSFVGCSTNDHKYAIMVLNRPIFVPDFDQLWNDASLRCCVDGGMDRFLEFKERFGCTLKPPEIFSGDFDSCTTHSMNFAEQVGCQIVKTPDENETDFTKALRSISILLRERDIETVLVVCETSGRMDQIMANINTLYKSRKILADASVLMLTSNSLSWLLTPGTHVIHIPQEIVASKRWCALVPFCKAQITTSGLMWNLENVIMEFGGMVSTSNTYQDGTTEVKVRTDNAILWTMGISSTDD